MNRNLIIRLSVVSLLFFIDGLAQRTLATDVSGIISSDTTWDLAGSPYVVTGTVLVEDDKTLTVEAGVEVRFNSGKSLQVFGELVAKGTSGSSITFTSVQESKAAGDWGQIVFYDSSEDAVFDENGDYASGSILEYCTVEYGGGIQLKLANPFINQGTIRYHSGRGIGTDNYNSSNNPATLKITNNTISNNAGGVYLYGLGTVLISGNTISNNSVSGSGAGIKIDGGDGVTISGNTIENNVAESEGGGIGGGGGYQVLNNVIKGNQAKSGGGVYGGGTITGNVISGNTATESKGGGFYEDGSGTFSNNYVLSNTGGGIYSQNGQSSITGNIIAGNTGELTSGPHLHFELWFEGDPVDPLDFIEF